MELDNGAGINMGPNRTPLQEATMREHNDVAELLLEYGAEGIRG